MRSTRPCSCSSAPNAILKQRSVISGWVKARRSAARWAVISGSSAANDGTALPRNSNAAPAATSQLALPPIMTSTRVIAPWSPHHGVTRRSVQINVVRAWNFSGRRGGDDLRGTRLQRADALGQVPLGLGLAAGRGLAVDRNAGCRGIRCQNRLDARAGAFECGREPRHLGGDVVDALAQQRVLHPLGGPGAFRLALHALDFELGARPLLAFQREL